MAEELQDNDNPNPNEEIVETGSDFETKIRDAMLSRVSHFKEQADSLTFEGVRRLLEKDLCLEAYALDVHKRYIKQCLVKCLEGAEDDNASKDSGEISGKSVGREEATESLEGHQSKISVKEPCLEDVEKMEDSPVMGLLTGHKPTKLESEGIEDTDDKELPSEITIKKAVRKRIPYFKANSEKITMAGVRRLLEDDLKLAKYALDGFKKFISQQVEEILNSCEAPERGSIAKKSSKLKASKKVSKETSESTDNNSSEEESDEVKPGKKNAAKGKILNSDEVKKRKRPAKETVSSKKQSKHVHPVSEDDGDEDDGENVSEDGYSQSSSEKLVKKEVSTPVYGKRVENLKSVIKSCGMSVPPSVYKKIKQAPENKRESQLIKELEGILSREGLSANPTEKEIKEVKRKKERAKELEGIDLSNIVSNSRRRSTTSFTPPAKPKVPVETDGDVEDTDEEEEDDEDDDEGDEEEDDAADNGGDDESQSEEFNEDDNEDSD